MGFIVPLQWVPIGREIVDMVSARNNFPVFGGEANIYTDNIHVIDGCEEGDMYMVLWDRKGEVYPGQSRKAS